MLIRRCIIHELCAPVGLFLFLESYIFLDGIIYGLTIRNKDKIYDDKCSPSVISKVFFRVSQLKN